MYYKSLQILSPQIIFSLLFQVCLTDLKQSSPFKSLFLPDVANNNIVAFLRKIMHLLLIIQLKCYLK